MRLGSISICFCIVLMHIIGMINNLCHMIDMYRGVATLNKLINIDGDAEEVCNFAHNY